MKKFHLFGLVGLLAFIAMPIYAQEENLDLNDENLVAGVEDVVVDAEEVIANAENVVVDSAYEVETLVDELDSGVDEDGVVLEVADEAVEEMMDVDEPVYLIDSSEESGNAVTSFDGDTKHLISAMLSWGMGIGLFWVLLAWLILLIIAGWKIFTKAGEGGWKILIPIYNVYIMYKIVGMKNWFWYALAVCFVLGLIAGVAGEGSTTAEVLEYLATLFAGIVGIVASFRLPRKFGWGVFASILYVLFPGICALILGFGKSKYEGKSDETVVEA